MGIEPGAELAPPGEEWSSARGVRRQDGHDEPNDCPLARALEGETVNGERVTVERPEGTTVVLEAGAKELPAERDLFLGHVDREAQRLVRPTRALLQLARIESGVDTAGPGGFGLGLAIAREAVQAMDGTLALSSEPGTGTTADIELRAATLVRVP